MTQDLTVGKPLLRVWQFAVPVLFGLLLQQVYSLVDTAIVGHALGVMALGGVGATGSVNFLVLGFCGGLCTGMAIPLAQSFGAGEYHQLRRYVAGCVWLGLIMSALLLAVSFALSGCSLVKNIGGSSGAGTKTITRPAVESAELQFTHPAAGEPVAVFDTTAGVFRAVLFPEQAPQAYDNFVGLVQAGYYNGLTVTRVEQDFVVEAGQGADGKGTTIWNGSRYPAEATDKLHHYSGALCMAADSSGKCASVFYIMSTLPGGDSVTQELTDQMNSAGYRAEVVSAYQTAGGAPYLDYTDTVLGQVYEGMDVVDTIAQAAVDENQKPTETITINSVSIETYQAQ